MFGQFILLIFPALLLTAAIYDLSSYRIPNWIPACLAGAFLPTAYAAGLPLDVIGAALGVGLAVLVVGMVLFGFKLVGGGDAKLLAAAVLWIGYDDLFLYLIRVGMIGGAFAFGLLVFRRMPLPAMMAGQGWIARLHSPQEGIPYGIALAGAGFLVYPQTVIYAHLLG